MLRTVRGQYEVVLIDTSALLENSDARTVAARVDGVLVVIRLSRDTRAQAEQARDILVSVGANALGVIVNEKR